MENKGERGVQDDGNILNLDCWENDDAINRSRKVGRRSCERLREEGEEVMNLAIKLLSLR